MRKTVMVILPSPWLISDKDVPSLGVLYIAAYLRQLRMPVEVVDLNALSPDHWIFPEGDIYGISCSTPQWNLAKIAAQKIRDQNPKAYIVAGGPHPSALPQKVLDTSQVDCVVVGDGETAMYEIVCDGHLGEIVLGQPIQDLDSMPWPARDMIDIERYHPIGTNAVIGGGALKEEYVIQSRGCPFKCAYCAQGVISNHRVRYRCIEDIQAEMTFLRRRYDINRFYVFDDTFVLNPSKVIAFCKMVKDMRKEGDFDWHCLARADNATIGLYRIMAENGCRQITFGLEHADDSILKRNLKGCTAHQNMRATEIAKVVGMRVRGQLMVGLPGETDETVETLADFIRNCPADSMAVHIFVPLPGSAIYHHPERFGFDFNRQADWSDFQTIGKPGEWSAHKIHKNSEDVLRWAEYLRDVIADKNVYKKDARLST